MHFLKAFQLLANMLHRSRECGTSREQRCTNPQQWCRLLIHLSDLDDSKTIRKRMKNAIKWHHNQ